MDMLQQLQSTLGNVYTLERELGGGGMSRVFVAREDSLGRKVVIKVLRPEFAAGLSAERFAREVRVAAGLQHPNIVPLFSAGETLGLPYYVMPYVKGESLRARLTREGRLPQNAALSVLHDIARALAFANGQGLVHRDVKPENVLLEGDAAVVTDFGIAKAVSLSTQETGSRSTDISLTSVGVSIGTPAYMAPEQAAGDVVDHRADLYAWGMVAYELLAGVHPFAHRASGQQLLAAQLTEHPVPLGERCPDLPLVLTGVVMRCLEKDPAKRPATARDILDALTATTRPHTPVAVTRRRIGKRTGLAAAGAVALLVMVGAYVAATRGGTAPAAPAMHSLAVLPFEDVGGDTANAYFGDGLADELSIALSKVSGLRVASRTSASAFRSQRYFDVRELGRQLGVTTVLEGRVRRAGGRMRLSVQLTSVSDGLTLWSDTFEREVTDVFQLQEEIARSIVAALRARLGTMLGGQADQPVAVPGTADPEAYDLYLRGTYLLERRGSGVEKSIDYFERAIAKDSRFARAHAGLSNALELMPYFAGVPARAVERRATEAAYRALALDSSLAEAHTALAQAYQHAYRWPEAGEAFRRAIRADSSDAAARLQYGRYLVYVGRLAEAEEQFRRARVLDPLWGTASVWLAHWYSLMGRHDEALAEGRRAWDLDSTLATTRTFVSLDALDAGRPGEARRIAGTAAMTTGFDGVLAYVHAASGDRERAAGIVRTLEARPQREWLVVTGLAYAYLGLRDTARALIALEAAARDGEITPTFIPLADRIFDPLRGSTRFAAVVRRFGLDEATFTSATGGRPR
jgi:eukaryotic-like serine/threonine-protein kinase